MGESEEEESEDVVACRGCGLLIWLTDLYGEWCAICLPRCNGDTKEEIEERKKVLRVLTREERDYRHRRNSP